MKKLVSAVVPAYNEEKVLEGTQEATSRDDGSKSQ